MVLATARKQVVVRVHTHSNVGTKERERGKSDESITSYKGFKHMLAMELTGCRLALSP